MVQLRQVNYILHQVMNDQMVQNWCRTKVLCKSRDVNTVCIIHGHEFRNLYYYHFLHVTAVFTRLQLTDTPRPNMFSCIFAKRHLHNYNSSRQISGENEMRHGSA